LRALSGSSILARVVGIAKGRPEDRAPQTVARRRKQRGAGSAGQGFLLTFCLAVAVLALNRSETLYPEGLEAGDASFRPSSPPAPVRREAAKRDSSPREATPSGDGSVLPRLDGDPHELECGDLASHAKLSPQRQGDGARLDSDHVPSNAALRKRAQVLLFGAPLTGTQERTMRRSAAYRRFEDAIRDAGLAIAIPSEAHRDLSKTYGGRNHLSQQFADSRDLQAAARRDVAAIQAGLAGYDRACVPAYSRAADRVTRVTNDDYDRLIQRALGSLSASERREMTNAHDAL